MPILLSDRIRKPFSELLDVAYQCICKKYLPKRDILSPNRTEMTGAFATVADLECETLSQDDVPACNFAFHKLS